MASDPSPIRGSSGGPACGLKHSEPVIASGLLLARRGFAEPSAAQKRHGLPRRHQFAFDRPLGTALGTDLSDARESAYTALGHIQLAGAHFRTDIARSAAVRTEP